MPRSTVEREGEGRPAAAWVRVRERARVRARGDLQHSDSTHLQLGEQRSQQGGERGLRLLRRRHAAEDIAPLGEARVCELGQQRA
eukprot:scaffold27456_cov45-Phaeocystis_antarctica.AAC.4